MLSGAFKATVNPFTILSIIQRHFSLTSTKKTLKTAPMMNRSLGMCWVQSYSNWVTVFIENVLCREFHTHLECRTLKNCVEWRNKWLILWIVRYFKHRPHQPSNLSRRGDLRRTSPKEPKSSFATIDQTSLKNYLAWCSGISHRVPQCREWVFCENTFGSPFVRKIGQKAEAEVDNL